MPSEVPIAMLTNFRCFTDGCVAFDGTPLQWKLEQDESVTSARLSLESETFEILTELPFGRVMS